MRLAILVLAAALALGQVSCTAVPNGGSAPGMAHSSEPGGGGMGGGSGGGGGGGGGGY